MSFNLADLFEQVADSVPDREAIVCDARRLTYNGLEERANRLANYWKTAGVKAGDHIGLQLRNGSEYIEGMLAAYKLRAVPINVNYNYVEDELKYLFDDADLVALVAHQQYLPRIDAIRSDLPKLRWVSYVGDASNADVPADCEAYEDTLANASAERDFEPRQSDDVYIVYTGGTTGMPKGVMWRHEDIFFAAMGGGDPDQSKGPIGTPEEITDRIGEMELAALPIPPFMHAAAQWLAFNTLFGGGKLVIPPGGTFDPKNIWRTISDEKVMLLVLVGDAMATPLADELEENPGDYDPSSLFVLSSGGALFSPSTKERLLKLLPGRMILDGLGSSETGLMGSKLSTDNDAGSAEPRFAVNEFMRVIDDNNKPIEPGSAELGRLARKGRVPMGYHKAPEKSKKTFIEIDGETWAIPGDLATVEADGSILLRGRGSTSINTGGEKVFPEEVESIVKSHADIADAVVVGVADDRFGQQVVAVCQTRSGKAVDVEELREFCRGKLAGYKLPRSVVHAKQIKRSPAGKADYPWAQKFAADQLESAQA